MVDCPLYLRYNLGPARGRDLELLHCFRHDNNNNGGQRHDSPGNVTGSADFDVEQIDILNRFDPLRVVSSGTAWEEVHELYGHFLLQYFELPLAEERGLPSVSPTNENVKPVTGGSTLFVRNTICSKTSRALAFKSFFNSSSPCESHEAVDLVQDWPPRDQREQRK